jgi:hypothetical protein
MRYLALIGDIRESRGVENRKALQEQLRSALVDLNNQHGSELVSPFTLTLGDEFQALFGSAGAIWQCLFAIQAQLHPVAVRFGLGVGEITTGVNRESALGMDGPAFYRARDAINMLKETEGAYRTEGLGDQKLVNHSLELLSGLQSKWHQNRFEVLYRRLAGEPVDAIAEALGISRTAVYKNIAEGFLNPIGGMLADIAGIMDRALEG